MFRLNAIRVFIAYRLLTAGDSLGRQRRERRGHHAGHDERGCDGRKWREGEPAVPAVDDRRAWAAR